MSARSVHFPRELREGVIPGSVIGYEQAAWAKTGICGTEFPKHVLVRMQTVVNENVDDSMFLK